ncbi:hypothetical protein Goarm_000931 [Gossypium armourianum]|uniref:F-box domain-containing protein n=1 Tax=Gossypium armourianum TaxID=34283 RepID=A0A7J9KBK6_9ROSI|nr:hypothetical protein [Gossypium armourianum]
MATLLRKVWESVSARSTSTSHSPLQLTSSSATSSDSSDSSLGPCFDSVPLDILLQILRLVGPKDAIKLGCVSRAWRSLVSDNRLWIYFLQYYQGHDDPWDSVFFAELNLRSGYPLQTFPSRTGELSFMRIYGQRAQVSGSVIIDGGSGYCKFGWSKYACPSGRSATFLEFGNIESPMYARLRHFFGTIYSRMQVKPSTQPIVLSIPICHYDASDNWASMVNIQFLTSSELISPDTDSAKASRRQLKDAIHTVLFDMNVPAVCAVNQATLALFAARRTSGIVVNIGFQVTSVVPILNGKVMRKVGVEVIGLGALKLTGYLRELMQQNNINFESLYTVRTLKENLCYVAADYKTELSKDTRASMEVPAVGWFTLSKERFQTGEILFQPRIGGVRAMGLHQAVALCMDHCHAAELTYDDTWFKTIVLSGGTACLPGLAERLEKELHETLSPSLANGLRVIPPPHGPDTAWFGAKFISNVSYLTISMNTT